MLAALRRVSLRHFAAHKLRTLSTVLGIALGVATLVGIRLVNESVSRSFARTIDRMAGKTVLQITNGDIGVPEDLVNEVKAVPGVKVTAPSVQGFVPVAGLQGGAPVHFRHRPARGSGAPRVSIGFVGDFGRGSARVPRPAGLGGADPGFPGAEPSPSR